MTFEEVRDVVFAILQEGWSAGAPDIVELPDAPIIHFENLDDPCGEPDGDFYAKAFLEDLFSDQITFGQKGCRLFERQALLTVQINTPGGIGMTLNDRLATLVVDLFEGESACGICFRRVRRVRIGGSGSLVRTDVLAELEYDVQK